MGARKFSFFESFDKIASKLSDEDRLALFDAMRDFAFRGVVPEFDGTLDLVWDAIEPNIESSIRAQENGRKGGRGNASKDGSKDGSKADVEAGVKRGVKTPGKKQGFKPVVSTDMDMDREEEVSFYEKKPSSDPASDGAAAAKAAPASADDTVVPRCRSCGSRLRYDPKHRSWRCTSCDESVAYGGEVSFR